VKETAAFEDTVSQTGGSNAIEDLDRQSCSSGALCAVRELFAVRFTTFCTSMTGEKLRK